MEIMVFHKKSDRNTGDDMGLGRMAIIECGDREIDDALEYAWKRTNNIYGSWSRGRYVEGDINNDYSEDIKEIATREKGWDGKEYGHRSSMVGDYFVKCPPDGIGVYEPYRVAPCGFEKVTDEEFFKAANDHLDRN